MIKTPFASSVTAWFELHTRNSPVECKASMSSISLSFFISNSMYIYFGFFHYMTILQSSHVFFDLGDYIYIHIGLFYPCCVSSALFSLGLARWNTVNNMSFLHCTTLLSKKGRIYGYPYLRSKAWLKKVFIYVINHCVCTQLNTATKYCHWYLLQIIQVT